MIASGGYVFKFDISMDTVLNSNRVPVILIDVR